MQHSLPKSDYEMFTCQIKSINVLINSQKSKSCELDMTGQISLTGINRPGTGN